ncbi:MAG: response regulator [Ignavibacteria bacterium]
MSTEQTEIFKKTKILIVDDMPENLQVLGSTLREKGFHIAFAINGKQAISIAQVKIPHMILLDVSMPEMDGFTVCKKLKENPQTKNIPVIFLTARIETDSIMKALKAGAVDYVVKPFIPSELLTRIVTHLGLDQLDENSSHVIRNLKFSELKSLLEGEFIRKWKNAQSGMFIDDITDFALQIKKLGEGNENKILIEYGDNLYQHASQLRIDKMTQVLDQYPGMVQKIISLQ